MRRVGILLLASYHGNIWVEQIYDMSCDDKSKEICVVVESA